MWTWDCPAACGPDCCRGTCRCPEVGCASDLFLLAPLVSEDLEHQTGPSPQPSPLPTERLLHLPPPPLTVAFCFLGDTSIRRCVRVTNLQAGQLSQGSLTKRVGKADTLRGAGKPVPWQQWAAGPSGFSSWVQSKP